jgi:hypothetical protein
MHSEEGYDLQDALAAATELRRGMEVIREGLLLLLLALLPAFPTNLTHKRIPTTDTGTIQHKLRSKVLELLSRIPANQV